VLAFARALLERWDRRVISPRPLGMVFRRPQRPGVATVSRDAGRTELHRHFKNTLHVDLRPRIVLTVVRPDASREMRTAHAGPAAAPRGPIPAGRLGLRNTSAAAAERVVERLLSRARRVDVVVRPPAAGAEMQREHAAPDPPPALVVQRPAAPAAAATLERHPDALSRTAPGMPDAAPPAPPIDLGQITDQVVSAIDYRLSAQAERLGRG